MLLANLLNPKAILLLDGEYSKEEVYRLLLGRICQKQELPECGEELLTKIIKRDQESSTAYPTGIAIPHIRVEGFQ
ncbi:MAG: PTS sugar transporter subunit IIA, partial [Candidatus Cloacimonadaceae bacterium]